MANRLNRSRTPTADESSLNSSLNRSQRIAERERRREAHDPLDVALKYFTEVKAGTPVKGNDEVEKHLAEVERAACMKGLSPEAISIMLEYALSLRMGPAMCSRVLKILIPATVVPQEAVVRGMVWLGVSNIPMSTQVLFIKWVLTMFDLIDSKDQLRAIYGFIFNLVTDENLCPFICHLLYLLTRKESIRVFRVRKLLELQNKLGKQSFLLHLLALYKVFRPEMVTISIPSQMKVTFRNHNSQWKNILTGVQKRNHLHVTTRAGMSLVIKTGSRKRKHLELPTMSCTVNKQPQAKLSSKRKVVPLVEVQSFAQLLENIHCIELPAQMGSLLGSSLALHYLDCVQDESALLRLNFWLGHALHEEFLFCGEGRTSQNPEEVEQFLDVLLSTQKFVQESFSSSEVFLYKFLNVWDGSLFRFQIFGLLTSIPVIPSSQIGTLLFEPLMKLYFTSSMFFKCGLLECLHGLLLKWLTWHSVYAQEDDLDISINSQDSMHITLSGFKDSVLELLHFVGRLACVGLQLEDCSSFLLSFVLDFYETVCDIFVRFRLPLVELPPPGVFFPALFSCDPVSVDRLAFIMSRYKVNLLAAKAQEKSSQQPFHISRQTFCEFNHYLGIMVNCLWNNKLCHSGKDAALREELLLRSNVSDYQSSYDLLHHPAFVGYALDFHLKCWPERKHIDLKSIKQITPWSWYLEYLFNQGYDGLRYFIQSSIGWKLKDGDAQNVSVSSSQSQQQQQR